MNDTVHDLADALTELLRSRRPRPSLADATDVAAQRKLWAELQDLGFTLTSGEGPDSEAEGSVWHASAVVLAAARLGVSLPLGETGLLASWALNAAAATVPVAMLTWASSDGDSLSVHSDPASGALRVTGLLPAVPHARTAELLVLAELSAGKLLTVPLDRCLVTRAENLAAEPRDDVYLDGVDLPPSSVLPIPDAVHAGSISSRAALVRTLCIAGALERVTQLAAEYASQRVQFGRPIASFQAIRHYIAQLVAETAAVDAAVAMAISAVEAASDPDPVPAVAAAKTRAGQAVRVVTKMAHQVHGAIGYTTEHELHVHTSRLWAWREEGGTEEEWAAVLGRRACSGRFDIWRTG